MVLAVGLTEGGRQTIAILLVILHVVSVFVGAGLGTVGFFLRYSLQSKVSLVDGYDGNVLPIVLMVVGSLTAVVNLVGSKVAFVVTNPVNRKRLRSLLMVNLVLLLVVLLALLTAGSMCFAHRHHLSRSFHHGLIKAMGKYQEDYKLKYDIDMLQIQNECCGNNGYEDWLDVQWINNNFLDLSNSKIQSKMTTGQYLTDDVPFSCCRPTSPRPCIHHQVQDNDIHYNYDYHTDLTLHTIGCKEKLMEYFGSQFTKLGAAAFGLLGVQIIALLLARYLQTSIAGAIAEGDPEASAPGSLCPGGDGPSPSKGDRDGGTKLKTGGGMAGGVPFGKGISGPGGSMDDFKDHDLDDEEGYDTLLDDSTFDEDFDEPINANTSIPTKGYNPYENDDRYGSELVYKDVKRYESESPYEEPIRREEEPLYENIPAYPPASMEDLYETIPAYAPPAVEDLYENIAAYAAPVMENLYENIPAYAHGIMEDLYQEATDAPLPPMLPSGPPPQKPKGAPPPRPTSSPPKKPGGPPPSKTSSPKKKPPPRPSQPPSRPSPGGKAKSGKSGPPRPDKPPSKKSGGSQPKTSTPKKSAPKKSPKADKKNAKSSPKRSGSASPSKSGGVKKTSAKTKSAKPASTTKSTKSKTSSKSKSAKRSPSKSPKRSPTKSPKSTPKTKSAPKWKKGPPPKGGKGKSPGAKRGGAKKPKKRSKNRNNNILESSESERESSNSSSLDSEETDSSSLSSSLDSSSLDLEAGSISGESEEWSVSSDTPLLR